MNASKENVKEARRRLRAACDSGGLDGRMEMPLEDERYLFELLDACESKLPCEATYRAAKERGKGGAT